MQEKEIKPTSIGGQAVIEGVMMRGKKMYAMAVRRPDNTIEVQKKDFKPISEKYGILKLPILRGVVAFVESLVIGMKIISDSAEMSGLTELEDDQPPSSFDRFLTKTFGDKLNDYIIYFSVAIAIVIAVLLFMLLPVWLSSFTRGLIGENKLLLSIVEGVMRIAIFLLYIGLISRTKDIQRIFMYHGAEHKTINCFEHRDPLTVENVRKHTRLHKRCGTSFLLIVMVVSVLVFMFVKTDTVWLRVVSMVLLTPLIA